MLERYVHHCAEMIQKTWRGYIIRRKYKIALNKMYRFQEIVGAMVSGKTSKFAWLIARMEDEKDPQMQKSKENSFGNRGDGTVQGRTFS